LDPLILREGALWRSLLGVCACTTTTWRRIFFVSFFRFLFPFFSNFAAASLSPLDEFSFALFNPLLSTKNARGST
jgi:hypothetical protein